MQIPNQYNTFYGQGGIGVSPDGVGDGIVAKMQYDLITRQAIPLIIRGDFVDKSGKYESKVEFLCVVANNTVEGSRVADKEKPWESTGVKVSTRGIGWMAAGITALVLAL